MKVDRNSWIVKWAYGHGFRLVQFAVDGAWDDPNPPSRTTLCALWWRFIAVGIGVNLITCAVFIVSSPLWALGLWIKIAQESAWGGRVADRFADGFDALDSTVRRLLHPGRKVEPKVGTLGVIAALLRMKRKVCPLIEIE